jgi:phage shock protein PspC (stress-responsive transcriptional regulator)
MQSGKGNLFTRDDTFFGVCEGLGEDLRIPSNLFRMGFALGLFFSLTGAVAVYLALGALVLVSRLLFPAPRAPRQPQAIAPAAAEQPATAKVEANDPMDLEVLPIAA